MWNSKKQQSLQDGLQDNHLDDICLRIQTRKNWLLKGPTPWTKYSLWFSIHSLFKCYYIEASLQVFRFSLTILVVRYSQRDIACESLYFIGIRGAWDWVKTSCWGKSRCVQCWIKSRTGEPCHNLDSFLDKNAQWIDILQSILAPLQFFIDGMRGKFSIKSCGTLHIIF